MTVSYLEYELQKGYIHNWLVAGPLATPISDPDRYAGGEPEKKLQIAQHYYSAENDITELPVDRAGMEVDGTELRWRYVRCLDDHFVDQSTFHHTWTYLRSWAYTQVHVWEDQDVTFVLTTNGPADVWINGEHVHRQEHFHHQQPASVRFAASLRATDDDGNGNEILVRFEEVAARECPYVMALQIEGLDDADAAVKVPTAIRRVARQLLLERAFPFTSLGEVVNHRGKVINLYWSDDLDVRCNYSYQVMDDRNRTYVSGNLEAKPGEVVDVGHGFRLWERAYNVVLRARPEEYFADNIRYQWELPIQVLDTDYAEAPYGTYDQRREEALKYAAERQNDLYAEIAKCELGAWDDLDVDVVLAAIDRINQREDCSDFYLVGLLGMLYRYADDPAFPETLKAAIEGCALNFKYWHDEPGVDAMCYTTENHSILFHTCEVLAGQLYPDAVFSNTGETGQWHREKGERLALDWLKTRGATGFWEWDSNCYFDEDLLALSHLVDLAETDEVVEFGAVVMDKMFYTMAVNSYKGVFGSTHGRTYSRFLKSARMEATSGINRLMFGMGTFNPSIRGMVGLACSEYTFPVMFAGIAADLPDAMWNRERHVVSADGDEVNKVTYKTADYMLCSAQDYHPGEKGYQQHIWQATFGPDAVAFVTHPPCMSEDGAHRPNFWHGNYVLPRVAQWKDVLFALHKLPDDDWMGFTHAYFPVHQFDAYVIRDGWAFAQKGDGYLALYASQGVELIKRDVSAYYELRSYGRENVWICQMGREALDGDFEAFQEKVLGQNVEIDGLAVHYDSLRGETLSFGWETPLVRDGVEEPVNGFAHYDGPYCVAALPASKMDISFGGYVLRLAF